MMTELQAQITAACEIDTDTVWRDVAESIAAAADMGRTVQWKTACAWPLEQIQADSTVEPRWAVLQGTVWLAHANS